MKAIRLISIYTGLFIGSISQLSGQTIQPADSISLNSILKQVLTTYPAIEKSTQELNGANARIGMARTGYYPDITLSSSYSHIGPVSSFNMPGYGTFSLFPEDNFSATINYNQTIYDFGKTSLNVDYEKQNKDIVSLSSEQIKQKLSLAVINIYYSIVFLQDAVRIKNEQIATLNEHLQFIEKKQETGSATRYEILTTQVKISAIENQKTDLETVLKIQVCQLNSFLGEPENNKLVVRKELQEVQPVESTDSLLAFANITRMEIKLAIQKTVSAELRYNVIKNQNNPVFGFFSSAGIKNGYTPDINTGKANYIIGLSFRLPIFDAGRKKNGLLQVKADIQSNKEDIELTKRTVVNEVIESLANMQSAQKKITQSELQLKMADQAYNLAETSFKSGVITNLELLDSSTSRSEAGLSVLKAKIDYSLSLLKLKISLGEKIY